MAARKSTTLRSMTGFGRGQASNPVASAEAELRSVNGKGLSFKFRLPNDRLDLEPVLDARGRRALERGNVQANLRIRLTARRGASVDNELLKRYLKEWRRTERELGLANGEPTLSDLLALPGVLENPPETDATARAVHRAASQAFDLAITDLVEAREKEGASLQRELLRLTGRLQRDLAQTIKRVPAAHRANAKKLRQRIHQAWESANVKEPLDLTREIAVLAEKADVSEEVARLQIHFTRLDEMLQKGGPCGRELEFLVQECLREVTTLGNKSADVQLSEMVVAMKSGIQRVREQVANVE